MAGVGSISVTPDAAQLQALLAELADVPNGLKRATSAAVNRTLVTGRSRVTKGITAEIALQQKFVRDVIKITRATSGKQEGKITIEAKGMSLMLFRPTMNKRGVSVKTRKSKGRELLKPGTFIATMKGGKGVFERPRLSAAATGPVALSPKASAAPRTVKAFERITRSAEPREPRRPVFRTGPSPLGVLEHAPGVLDDVLDDLGDEYLKNLASQVDRFLSRSKSDRSS